MILPNPGGKVGHRRTHIKSSALQFRLEGRGVFIALFNRIERAQCGFAFLHIEQSPFTIEAATVSGEAAVRSDHAMTRHDNAYRIVTVRQADGAERAR